MVSYAPASWRRWPKITLGVPWLESGDQELLFAKDKRYATSEDQAAYVKGWLVKAGLEEESNKLDLLFYPARYHEPFGSIFPMGDLAALVPDDEADVAVLEEPEHLNFFRAEGVPWLNKFGYVVGIIHTNYLFYARGEKHGVVKKPIMKAACALTVRAHCHRVIKLSDSLQSYAKEKEMVANVHGVRPQFFEVGDKALEHGFTEGAYFIGKVLWTKGLDLLLALMHRAREGADDSSADSSNDGDTSDGKEKSDGKEGDSETRDWEKRRCIIFGNRRNGAKTTGVTKEDGGREAFPITIYGDGSDLAEVKEKAGEMNLPITFHRGIDHAELGQYKVFVNPSRSEVLCTTIAEALAMGKWVVCAHHPSNEFFYENFESCLTFTDEHEFVAAIKKALAEDPPRLSVETRFKDRKKCQLHVGATLPPPPPPPLPPPEQVPGCNTASKSGRGLARLDKLLAGIHGKLMKGERGDHIRKAMGAGPVAKQNTTFDSHR
eukprot:jgi/Undpi1/6948/HiC_scaffold_21.g09422.m1